MFFDLLDVTLSRIAMPLGLLVISGWLLFRVYKEFRQRSLRKQWWLLLVSSIPLAVGAIYVAFAIAGMVSGMEGLAVFYGVLFTLSPLLYFSGLLLLGRVGRAKVPYGLIFALGALVLFIGREGQGLVVGLKDVQQQSARISAREELSDAVAKAPAALPFQVTTNVYKLAGHGFLLHARLHGTQALTIERISETVGDKTWEDATHLSGTGICQTSESQINLFFYSAENENQPLLIESNDAELANEIVFDIYWRNASGELARSALPLSVSPELKERARPFQVTADTTQLTVSAPVPMGWLSIEKRYPKGNTGWRAYSSLMNERFGIFDNCVRPYGKIADDEAFDRLLNARLKFYQPGLGAEQIIEMPVVHK